MGEPVTVFLVNDHEVVRDGLRALLEAAGLKVVGEAATAAEAVVRIVATRPQVAVLDVNLPDGSGIDLCRDVRSALPETACLMLGSFDDDETRLAAIMAGATGYLLRQIRGLRLVESVQLVAQGHSLFAPNVTTLVLEQRQRVKAGLRVHVRSEIRQSS